MDCVRGKIYIKGAYVFVFDKQGLCTSLKSGRVLDECRVIGRTQRKDCISLTDFRKKYMQRGKKVRLVDLKPGQVFCYNRQYYVVDPIVEDCLVRLNDGKVYYGKPVGLCRSTKVRTYTKHFNF